MQPGPGTLPPCWPQSRPPAASGDAHSTQPFCRPCQTEPLHAKALAFSSVAGARGVQERSMDTDIVAAEVAPQVRCRAGAVWVRLLCGCRSRSRRSRCPSDLGRLLLSLSQVLANLQALLSDLFIPLVAAQQPTRQAAESAKDEFIQVHRVGEGMATGL